MELTIDKLPEAVSQLNEKLDRIEALIQKQPQPTEPEDKLLTVREAAEFMSLAVPTIYSNVANGKLPSMKMGKKLYFSKKELLEYLKTTRRKTVDEMEQEAENHLNR
ncbi:MAG: helix-turn-helix domain-containing protein [Bacteroidales bacterium]|nr:helix-turn-helix domain-containing protein [Bacteroidales bacterium]MCF8337179.1 helix-turn-helix domain-containing protein [Bacteroidales bacterium]